MESKTPETGKTAYCSHCKILLTVENAPPSYVKRGAGRCDSCISLEYKQRRQIRKENGICCFCGKKPQENGTTLCSKCMGYVMGYGKKWKVSLRLEVLTHYCDGAPYCQCIGCRNGKENPVHIGALQVDHVAGDGSKHLDINGRRIKGEHLWLWLKQNNYPSGFQVLCANCNTTGSKGANKFCPRFGESH